MPSDYEDLRAELDELRQENENLKTGVARLEGAFTYMVAALQRIEGAAAAEASAALEVRKAEALQLISERGARSNHRRELALKALVILTGIVTLLGALLGM